MTNNTKKPNLKTHIVHNKTTLLKFTTTEVLEQLQRLDTRKAPGPANLSAKILKEASLDLFEVITHLFNGCIRPNIIPNQWKEANIAPVLKVARPTKASDYRPISLTSTLCKIMERLLAKIIIEKTKNIWVDNQQFGFLPGKSTSDAVIQVIEDWSKAIDNKQSISTIFFDFSKAFDLVNHELLLNKLEKHLPSWLTSWIAVYLTNRRQRVKTPDYTTKWYNVEAGVIQGSVLGPILFIIFLSDINNYIPPNIKAPKYADDIATYCIYNETSENNIQLAADGVNKWSEVNKMKLNIEKTQAMHINNKNHHTIKINNQDIITTSSYKYLGTYLNTKLDWDTQWEVLNKKFHCTLYLIKTLKNLFFKQEILITIYKSLVLSHIISNVITLSSSSQKVINEMTALQNRYLKIIGINNSQDLEKYKIETIENLMEKHGKKRLTKILIDPTHPITKSLENRETITRKNFSFVIPKCKSEKYQNSYLQKYLRLLEKDGFTTTSKPAERPPINNKNTKEGVSCEICEKVFKNTRGVNQHKRMMHKPSTC